MFNLQENKKEVVISGKTYTITKLNAKDAFYWLDFLKKNIEGFGYQGKDSLSVMSNIFTQFSFERLYSFAESILPSHVLVSGEKIVDKSQISNIFANEDLLVLIKEIMEFNYANFFQECDSIIEWVLGKMTKKSSPAETNMIETPSSGL